MTGHGQHLDLSYLHRLGPMASPALYWFATHATEYPDKAALAKIMAEKLDQDLEKNIESDWRAWTWLKARRYENIQNLE